MTLKRRQCQSQLQKWASTATLPALHFVDPVISMEAASAAGSGVTGAGAMGAGAGATAAAASLTSSADNCSGETRSLRAPPRSPTFFLRLNENITKLQCLGTNVVRDRNPHFADSGGIDIGIDEIVALRGVDLL